MPRKILYIDDRPELPRGFVEELHENGLILQHTSDPEQLIAWARREPPVLALVEIDLPGCDGIDLLGGLRDLRDEPIPTVVLTRAQRVPGLYGEAVAQGARDFLTKPVRTGDLLASVLRYAAPRESSQLDVGREPDAPDRDARGGLAQTPLPEILRELALHGSSGVLILSRGDVRLGVQLRNGSPVAVSSNRETEPLQDFLLRSGWIDRSLRDRVAAQVALGKQSAHEILVSMDALPENRMHAALCRLAEEQLFQAFAWTAGRYRFFLGRQLRPDGALECDPSRLVLDGVLHGCPPALVRERIAGMVGCYVSRAEVAGFDDLDLEPEQRQALESLDGERPLAAVLEAGVLDERLIFALWAARRVELDRSPTFTLTDALPGAAPVLGDDERDAAADPERALDAESWFRKGEAFLRSKSYDKAVEAFGMASHLDPAEGEYLSHLGYALFLSNPRRDVVRREAMEHVAHGIKLSPDRETSYVFLGRLLRLTGDDRTARKIFRKALKINPGCHAALQELRLLEMRKPAEAQGLLARLRRWRF